MIDQTVRMLKALGEPTRLKIMKFLSERELCICELEAILDMSQPRISQHVKVLKQAGLVTERKARQNSYISVNAASIRGPIIASFSSFIHTDLGKLPELKDENQRYLALDCNEAVQACKSRGKRAEEEQKRIS